MIDLDYVYDSIKSIIIDCGNLIMNANYHDLIIDEKEGNNNIVTNYDVLIQNRIKEELLKLIPDAGFIGEEDDFNNDIDNKYVFVVDPIDGTVNFSRNLCISAISIALLMDGNPVIGVCYNPYINELYEAKKSCGAYLNGTKIHVSNRSLANGIALCGCAPYYNDLRDRSLSIQSKLAKVASDYRRFGSAVIEICNIASGKAEVYFELKLMPWDYAAASLILTEAGGNISTINNDEVQYFESSSIFASNGVEDYFNYIN